MKTTFDKVKEAISDVATCNEVDIEPGADLVNDLNMDSLDLVELVMALEDDFDIEINDDDAAGLKTVQQVVDYVDKAAK
jgi:acyl carrier protein